MIEKLVKNCVKLPCLFDCLFVCCNVFGVFDNLLLARFSLTTSFLMSTARGSNWSVNPSMSHIARESIVGNHEHSTNLCASKEFEKETYYTGYCMVRFNTPVVFCKSPKKCPILHTRLFSCLWLPTVEFLVIWGMTSIWPHGDWSRQVDKEHFERPKKYCCWCSLRQTHPPCEPPRKILSPTWPACFCWLLRLAFANLPKPIFIFFSSSVRNNLEACFMICTKDQQIQAIGKFWWKEIKPELFFSSRVILTSVFKTGTCT